MEHSTFNVNPLTRWKLKAAASSIGSFDKLAISTSRLFVEKSSQVKELSSFSGNLVSSFGGEIYLNRLISLQSQIEQQQLGTEDKKRTGWPQSVWGRETLGRKTLK